MIEIVDWKCQEEKRLHELSMGLRVQGALHLFTFHVVEPFFILTPRPIFKEIENREIS